MSVHLIVHLNYPKCTIIFDILIRNVLFPLVVTLTLLILTFLSFLFFAGHYIFKINEVFCINITDQIYIVLRNTTFFYPKPAYPIYVILSYTVNHPLASLEPISTPIQIQYGIGLPFEFLIHVGLLNYFELN